MANHRLLVYDVAAGWQPLCEFLGVEIPGSEPFPRLNDSQTFHELMSETDSVPDVDPPD